MCRSNPLPSTLPSSPFCSILNTSYITASDMCEVCTEAVHSTSNTSYITGFAVCSYLTHLWCSYLSPKTGISVFLFDAFVVFLFEPGPLQSTNPVLLCTAKYYSSTTLYYKVLLCTTQYYSSTTLYYTVLLQYYSVLQSTTPVLQSTTPVLLCTTK